MTTKRVELAIVGAGPAGLSAAIAAAESGVKTLVLDERPEPGGSLLIRERVMAEQLCRRAREVGVEFLCGAEVWGLWPGWKLTVGGPAFPEVDVVEARSVLLATGTAESGLPFPGWTLPGIISVGAAQVLMHRYGILPGRQVVVVGTDPHALTTARDLAHFGANVVGIVLPPPGPSSPKPQPVDHTLAVGLPVLSGRCIVEAVGPLQVTQAILGTLALDGKVAPGPREAVNVDAICISGGAYPLAELAEASGECQFTYEDALGGKVPVCGPDMQTGAPGLFVAGGAAGVDRPAVALTQGTLAGLGAASFLGNLPPHQSESLLTQAAARVSAARQAG